MLQRFLRDPERSEGVRSEMSFVNLSEEGTMIRYPAQQQGYPHRNLPQDWSKFYMDPPIQWVGVPQN